MVLGAASLLQGEDRVDAWMSFEYGLQVGCCLFLLGGDLCDGDGYAGTIWDLFETTFGMQEDRGYVGDGDDRICRLAGDGLDALGAMGDVAKGAPDGVDAHDDNDQG